MVRGVSHITQPIQSMVPTNKEFRGWGHSSIDRGWHGSYCVAYGSYCQCLPWKRFTSPCCVC